MRSETLRSRSLERVSRRVAWFLLALCGWTLYIWITLVVIIGRQNHALGFKIVHDTLAVDLDRRSASAPASSAGAPCAPADEPLHGARLGARRAVRPVGDARSGRRTADCVAVDYDGVDAIELPVSLSRRPSGRAGFEVDS